MEEPISLRLRLDFLDFHGKLLKMPKRGIRCKQNSLTQQRKAAAAGSAYFFRQP
ncbi:hypothetical protein SELSPUOL_01254 [Selenomonas sputigena ATCC 35185]|uniref:Uncharacterized protein n=1 Tax=Selenomonas sputigena (strain ATCC 35185 / DSM 20758 / CCUG 44933 / VPI D19B-28) TaxID=546271 RepID=C9LUW3_SELS3|nr:hypothetical protein SELSPUOL_01254 [Selenomonas sputigena ATCC 35185]